MDGVTVHAENMWTQRSVDHSLQMIIALEGFYERECLPEAILYSYSHIEKLLIH